MTATALTAALIVLTAGGAYAYWTVQGSGHSTATVGGVKALTIDVGNIKGLTLNDTVPIVGVIHNPNDFSASLRGLHLTMRTTVDNKHLTCSLKNFGIIEPTFASARTLPAGGDIRLHDGAITLIETGKDQDSCQGATLTFDYTLQQVHQ